MVRGLEELNKATKETLAEAYGAARVYLEAAAMNEKNTLETILQLAVDKKRVGDYLASTRKSVDQIAKTALDVLERHMKTTAEGLKTEPATIQFSALEKKASKIYPKPTDKVKANGYRGVQRVSATHSDDTWSGRVSESGPQRAPTPDQRQEQRSRHQEHARRSGGTKNGSAGCDELR
jgi:hypothetical protein